MRITKPGYTLLSFPSKEDMQRLERIGRVCWKSEGRITEDSYAPFIEKIVRRGHESVIEHLSATVAFTIDRGVSHELCRHRLLAISQESTRYCDYGGGDVQFISPPFWNGAEIRSWLCMCVWLGSMRASEVAYKLLRRLGATPEKSRSVLPNSLKTEVIVTANLREWRHIFSLRTSKAAHPQMRQVMTPLLADFTQRCPFLFGDIKVGE